MKKLLLILIALVGLVGCVGSPKSSEYTYVGTSPAEQQLYSCRQEALDRVQALGLSGTGIISSIPVKKHTDECMRAHGYARN